MISASDILEDMRSRRAPARETTSSAASIECAPLVRPCVDPLSSTPFTVSDSDIPRGSVHSTLLQMLHGTTTLGFMYQGGIVIAVDSRSTMGQYVSSGTVHKMIPINPYLVGTMAGGAADCFFWERELGVRVRLFELRNHVERLSVAAASKMLASTLADYHRKGYDLSVGCMLAGWDLEDGGKASLYYVDNEGKRIRGNVFSVGSGSTFAYGVLDQGYRWDLTDKQAFALGRRAIFHATHRDAFSGGVVNVFHIDKNGWKKISSDDQTNLFYGEQEPNDSYDPEVPPFCPRNESSEVIESAHEQKLKRQAVLEGIIP